jgi:dipeptide/tripeptide permease
VHALAMGLIVSALNLGQFINPLAMAPLRQALGASGAFLVVGLALLLVGLAVALWQRGHIFERRSSAAI